MNKKRRKKYEFQKNCIGFSGGSCFCRAADRLRELFIGRTGCIQSGKTEITVGITPGSSDQIMEVVAKEAAKQGLTVHPKVFSDYITPDQALANGDIDLNAFQHQPFLDAF